MARVVWVEGSGSAALGLDQALGAHVGPVLLDVLKAAPTRPLPMIVGQFGERPFLACPPWTATAISPVAQAGAGRYARSRSNIEDAWSRRAWEAIEAWLIPL
jgi:hypothetical protein